MGKAGAVIVGSAALLAIGVGAANAATSEPAATPAAPPACGLVGAGVACTLEVPGLGSGGGALGLVTDGGTGIAGNLAGRSADGSLTGNLGGDLQIRNGTLSGRLQGALGNVINGNLAGSATSTDGQLCGELNVAGIEVIEGGLHHDGNSPTPVYEGGGRVLGVPGGLRITPGSNNPIQFVPGEPSVCR